MFTSFDENKFRQAIKEKDYLRLKVSVISAMLDDPTFASGEADAALKILNNDVPEIFEAYKKLDYEEELECSAWDKTYFSKLTYWFQKNFAKERVAYIKKVGQAVHQDTAKKYEESLNIEPSAKGSKRNSERNNARITSGKPGNFPLTRVILITGALVMLLVIAYKVFSAILATT